MNNLGNLSENHQFVIALIAQVSSIVSMIFLYRSNPTGKHSSVTNPETPAKDPVKPA